MNKLFGILICLSAVVVLRCTDEESTIDPTSLFAITSGFSSSYMSFTITGGLSTVPEYKQLTLTSGLSLEGNAYTGVFSATDSAGTNTVTFSLTSPATGSEYLESATSYFSYTRADIAYTMNANYSTNNDFRLTISEWNGTGTFMKAAFSGYLCNGSGTTDCLTIENGVINAVIR